MTTNSTEISVDRYTGRVKWFNKKSGFGFITILDGEKAEKDVFAHYTSIRVNGDKYKFLVEGEYVQFNLVETKNENHEFQAGDITGISGGKLMCDTINEARAARYSRSDTSSPDSDVNEPVQAPRSVRPPAQSRYRARGEGPRENDDGWTYAAKTKRVPSSSGKKDAAASRRTNGNGNSTR